MTRLILIAAVLLAIGNTCEAGKRRVEFKTNKLEFKQAKLDSGVTLYRAKGFYHAAKSVDNVTGLINPVNWILGAVL